MMDKATRIKIKLEIVWWFFTALVALIVMLPVMNSVPHFPYFKMNVLFVVLFVTLTRYIFFFEHSILKNFLWLRVIILAVSVIFVFALMTSLGNFNSFLKNRGMQELVDHLPIARQTSLRKYLQNEIVLFGVGSIVAAIILPFKIIRSIWRDRNVKKPSSLPAK